MSRVYWHSKERDAELRGSERAWLGALADGPSRAAWGLSDPHADYDRAKRIMEMVVPAPDRGHGESYLHTYWRAAEEQERHNSQLWAQAKEQGIRWPATDYEPQRKLVSSLSVALRVNGVEMEAAGQRLHSSSVDLNTALVAGSDPVKLAAKIHGWCEVHCWIEGPDREWCAQIIDSGLRAGLYRRGLWYADQPDGPLDKWSDQGWSDVLALLRERGDGPVVLSYSVCDQFPNRSVAGWEPPTDVDLTPGWAKDSEQGRAEWAAMSDEDRADYCAETGGDLWDELPGDEQWELAMAGLRRERPWARIGPDTLAEVTFAEPVTVYDLFAPDRDRRVRAAFGLDAEPEVATALVDLQLGDE